MLLIETVHEVWVVRKKELVQRSSAAGKQRSTEANRGHKRSTEVKRGHQTSIKSRKVKIGQLVRQGSASFHYRIYLKTLRDFKTLFRKI